MKYIIQFLFITSVLLVCTGYYFKNTGNHPTGDTFVGVAVLLATFILMPLFIYHRWKNKNVKDYMLTEENLEKMKEYERKKDSQIS